MTERKVTVDEIIGIVKTEKATNSVEEVRKLRGRFTKRTIDNWESYIVDNVTGEEYGSKIDPLLKLLNELHEENTHLNNIISAIEKGSCRSIDSFLDDYCTDEMLKEFDLE